MMKCHEFVVALASVLTGCGGLWDVREEPPARPPDDAGERLARAHCDAARRCGCEVDEACEADLRGAFDEMSDALVRAHFQPSCFEQVVESYGTDECIDVPHEVDCTKFFVGDQREGEECVGYYGAVSGSDCEPGLNCLKLSQNGTARCHSPFSALPENRLDLGAFCDPNADLCASGLYCEDGELRCVPKLAKGETCYQQRSCDSTAFCQGLGSAGVGVCAPYVPIGDPCDPDDDVRICQTICFDVDRDCPRGVCTDGECQAPPEVNPLCSFEVEIAK